MTTVIRYFGETCDTSYSPTAGSSKCADGCKCAEDLEEKNFEKRYKCENDQTDPKKCLPKPIPRLRRSPRGQRNLPIPNEETSAGSQASIKKSTNKAYEQIYGDDYVQQRGVGGYIPMYDAPYHYEHVQPVYQPQLASSTNPDSMQYGLMLLGLGLFLCLAICIVFVLLSAVCFVVGRFSNA
eukprot:43350_1